jgi:hypothetical protein
VKRDRRSHPSCQSGLNRNVDRIDTIGTLHAIGQLRQDTQDANGYANQKGGHVTEPENPAFSVISVRRVEPPLTGSTR